MSKQEIERSKLKSFSNIMSFNGYATPRSGRNGNMNRIPAHTIFKRIGETNKDPFHLPDEQFATLPFLKVHNAFVTYQVRRTKSTNIRGKRTTFVLSKQDKVIYSAKYKPIKISDYIPIYDGDKPHFKNNSVAVLLFSNDLSDYSLRVPNKYGNEVLTLHFTRFMAEGAKPRHMSVRFYDNKRSLPERLENVAPVFKDDSWIVDLNSNDAISSIKNCKLIGDDQNPYAYIRKMEKEVLEVETLEEFDEICVFAFAISSFLCKK